MYDNEYLPMSNVAMFARIMERLDEVRNDVKATVRRVDGLEQDKWFQRGIAATIALLATGVWQWLTRK